MNMRLEAIAEAALQWARARDASRAAKAALLAYRVEHGSCTETLSEKSRGCWDLYAGPVWERQFLPLAEWCEVCAGSQPLWQSRKHAAIAVGVATRRLAYLCRKGT